MIEQIYIKKVELRHYTPFEDSFNVRCLNGSAHAHRTSHIEFVTCPLCLNPATAKEFWMRHEQKHGNRFKNYL